MQVSNLSGALLDYWVARAEGIPAGDLEIRQVPRTDNSICVRTVPSLITVPCAALAVMAYSTNWAQCGPLIEKRSMDVESPNSAGEPWVASLYVSARQCRLYGHGTTLMQAVCRAIVRAAFGGEVEDLPCA